MTKSIPTIKGIFVNSQVASVRNSKGEEGLKELEKRYGKPIKFGNVEDVPVAEEVRLIELAVQIINDDKISQDELAFEAGKLHFVNFATTPLARMIFSIMKDLKYILLNSKYISEHVFRGMDFNSEALDQFRIKITIEGGVYPLNHFKGLWWAWCENFGYKPKIEATQLSPEKYEYIIDLSEKK